MGSTGCQQNSKVEMGDGGGFLEGKTGHGRVREGCKESNMSSNVWWGWMDILLGMLCPRVMYQQRTNCVMHMVETLPESMGALTIHLGKAEGCVHPSQGHQQIASQKGSTGEAASAQHLL
jgi:hypothetical protein